MMSLGDEIEKANTNFRVSNRSVLAVVQKEKELDDEKTET